MKRLILPSLILMSITRVIAHHEGSTNVSNSSPNPTAITISIIVILLIIGGIYYLVKKKKN